MQISYEMVFNVHVPQLTLIPALTGSPDSKYVMIATACVYKELHGKFTDHKKNCVNNYLI